MAEARHGPWQDRSLLERLALLPPHERSRVLRAIPAPRRRLLFSDWRMLGRPAQQPPDGCWSVWLILAGRGFGKTRTGAAWVGIQALRHPGARIALVGRTEQDVLSVMVHGASGIVPTARPGLAPRVVASRRQILWPNGSQALMVSAMEPDRLRGPQFHFAWCDEIAAWPKPEPVWDNLRMGLRLGARPQAVVTTTPRPTRFLARLMAEDGVVVTRGTSHDNRAHLPPAFLAEMTSAYGGTALGRQEILGEIVSDLPGALWSRDLLERCRTDAVPELRRVVVGVDPPAGPGTCGIVVAGVDGAGRAFVLTDASVSGGAPDDWAHAVAAAAGRYRADRVVAEVNQGGAMVASVLRAAEVNLPLKMVRAARGKAARAEPVAALYPRGRVFHAGAFPALEDEMCGLIQGGGYQGPGSSPDRADALVWALSELMLGTVEAEPAFRML